MVKFEERSEDDDGDGESDKHLEARDRRYLCLKSCSTVQQTIRKPKLSYYAHGIRQTLLHLLVLLEF